MEIYFYVHTCVNGNCIISSWCFRSLRNYAQIKIIMKIKAINRFLIKQFLISIISYSEDWSLSNLFNICVAIVFQAEQRLKDRKCKQLVSLNLLFISQSLLYRLFVSTWIYKPYSNLLISRMKDIIQVKFSLDTS